VINIDKSGASKEAIKTYNNRCLKRIRIRQSKYLNNRVEGDDRSIKWRTHLMLGFKSFESASRTFPGIKIGRMINKGHPSFPSTTAYKSFWLLAAECSRAVK
jgi:putative transposase